MAITYFVFQYFVLGVIKYKIAQSTYPGFLFLRVARISIVPACSAILIRWAWPTYGKLQILCTHMSYPPPVSILVCINISLRHCIVCRPVWVKTIHNEWPLLFCYCRKKAADFRPTVYSAVSLTIRVIGLFLIKITDRVVDNSNCCYLRGLWCTPKVLCVSFLPQCDIPRDKLEIIVSNFERPSPVRACAPLYPDCLPHLWCAPSICLHCITETGSNKLWFHAPLPWILYKKSNVRCFFSVYLWFCLLLYCWFANLW